MIRLLLGCITLVMYSSCYAQELQNGERLGVFSATAHLGDRKLFITHDSISGKVLLLDVWSIRCSDCISGMPKLLALQNKFRDELRILLVTPDSREQVSRLLTQLSKHPVRKPFADAMRLLPLITDDTFFVKKLFVTGYPTHCWFDPAQRYLGITHSGSLNEQAVRTILDGNIASLPQKRHADFTLDDPGTWLASRNHHQPDQISYSIFTGQLERGKFLPYKKVLRNETKEAMGVALLNHTLLDFYATAYQDWIKRISGSPLLPPERLLIKTRRTILFHKPDSMSYSDWVLQHSFSYGLRRPVFESDSVLWSFVRKELDQHFGFKSSVQVLERPCYVLRRKGPPRAVSPKVARRDLLQANGQTLLRYTATAFGILLDDLQNVLQMQSTPIPLFSDLPRTEVVSLQIPWNERPDMVPIESVFQALARYGFEVKLETRQLEMLVIEDTL